MLVFRARHLSSRLPPGQRPPASLPLAQLIAPLVQRRSRPSLRPTASSRPAGPTALRRLLALALAFPQPRRRSRPTRRMHSPHSSAPATLSAPTPFALLSRPVSRPPTLPPIIPTVRTSTFSIEIPVFSNHLPKMKLDTFVPASPTGSSISDGDPPGYVPPSGGVKKSESVESSVGTRKRAFEELEEITFSNPKSFTSMAFAIAESRGIQLIVIDDRTHKVTSAYMHVSCAFRRSGCPLILKLTKAKEGGWVMKSSKATDVDPKQRSVYRCRHPAGSIADSPSSLGTTSHPGAPGSGSKPKAAKRVAGTKKDKVVSKDHVVGKLVPSRESRPSAKARENEELSLLYLGGGVDRALAPPFERSLSLANQVAPVLQGQEERGGPGWMPRGYVKPLVEEKKVVEPKEGVLREWRTFLERLDPELVWLAEVLSSAKYDVSLGSFFGEDDDMRTAFIEALREDEVGGWPKLKLARKVRSRGVEVWRTMVGEGLARGTIENGTTTTKATSGGTSDAATPVPVLLKTTIPHLPTATPTTFTHSHLSNSFVPIAFSHPLIAPSLPATPSIQSSAPSASHSPPLVTKPEPIDEEMPASHSPSSMEESSDSEDDALTADAGLVVTRVVERPSSVVAPSIMAPVPPQGFWGQARGSLWGGPAEKPEKMRRRERSVEFEEE